MPKPKYNPTHAWIKHQVLGFLQSTPNRAFNHKQIIAGAGLKNKISVSQLWDAIESLEKQGFVKSDGRGKFWSEKAQLYVRGRIQFIRNGDAFVIPEEIDDQMHDIFIPARHTLDAFPGDTVLVKIVREGREGRRPEGEVSDIVQRYRESYIGVLQGVKSSWFVVPDDQGVKTEFRIAADKLNGALPGQKVLVKYLHWDGKHPNGEIIRVLGVAGENNTEMHAILLQYGFEPAFPQEVEEEAERIPVEIPKTEIAHRRDFRDILTFTIDPLDAKDFDDAISFRKMGNGRMEIGVHIADVTWYVQPGTAIEREGFSRATSVYLVDRTVPMLPEKLSNQVCSLRPFEDKLTFSAVFEMDEEGRIHSEWFGRTIIHSRRRYTYEEAQMVLDTGDGDYAEELLTLNRLAHILRQERFKRGSINFEEDEVRFELDEHGKPLSVFRKIRKDAHKLIEDFMLLANRAVCRFIATRQTPPPPCVYRVHDTPNMEKLMNLKMFVKGMGLTLELDDKKKMARSLNKLMDDTLGKPIQNVVQSVAVRAMAKAVYSTENIHHYGLGFEYYTHFTSPIRRYPDMMIHRLLAQYLEGNMKADVEFMEKQCKHSSLMERKATEAERASVRMKQVEFIEDKVGQVFQGVISGVTNWGMYVEILENRCEGMVSLAGLSDDYYELDERNFCIRGRRKGKLYRVGDIVEVRIEETDMVRRTIELALIRKISGT